MLALRDEQEFAKQIRQGKVFQREGTDLQGHGLLRKWP